VIFKRTPKLRDVINHVGRKTQNKISVIGWGFEYFFMYKGSALVLKPIFTFFSLFWEWAQSLQFTQNQVKDFSAAICTLYLRPRDRTKTPYFYLMDTLD
jgi:hypothetical protein